MWRVTNYLESDSVPRESAGEGEGFREGPGVWRAPSLASEGERLQEDPRRKPEGGRRAAIHSLGASPMGIRAFLLGR